jgi:hypothetical protein
LAYPPAFLPYSLSLFLWLKGGMPSRGLTPSMPPWSTHRRLASLGRWLGEVLSYSLVK